MRHGTLAASILAAASALAAQQPPPTNPPGAAGNRPPGGGGQPPGAPAQANPTGPQLTQGAAVAGQPVSLDLAGALERARNYNQQFMQAFIAAGLAREDRVQAKAALFPTLN